MRRRAQEEGIVPGTQKNLGTWLSEEPRPRLEKPGEIIRTNLGRALSAEEPPKNTNLLQAGLLTWLFDARLLTLSAAQWRRCASNETSLTVAVTMRDSHPLPYSPPQPGAPEGNGKEPAKRGAQ
jgi:hypothetical protein